MLLSFCNYKLPLPEMAVWPTHYLRWKGGPRIKKLPVQKLLQHFSSCLKMGGPFCDRNGGRGYGALRNAHECSEASSSWDSAASTSALVFVGCELNTFRVTPEEESLSFRVLVSSGSLHEFRSLEYYFWELILGLRFTRCRFQGPPQVFIARVAYSTNKRQ